MHIAKIIELATAKGGITMRVMLWMSALILSVIPVHQAHAGGIEVGFALDAVFDETASGVIGGGVGFKGELAYDVHTWGEILTLQAHLDISHYDYTNNDDDGAIYIGAVRTPLSLGARLLVGSTAKGLALLWYVEVDVEVSFDSFGQTEGDPDIEEVSVGPRLGTGLQFRAGPLTLPLGIAIHTVKHTYTTITFLGMGLRITWE